MDKKELFSIIADNMIKSEQDLSFGKMMSCSAITYKWKVIAFFYRDKMVFKLGKDYGLKDGWEYLNPFKNKPPMIGWYVVCDSNEWKSLAKISFKINKNGNINK